MSKKFILTLAVSMTFSLQAAPPEGYYDDAIGKSGSSLQSTLADIIDHSDPGYDSLWDIYKTTDRRADGKVWDMYSNTSNFTFGSDQCGNYSGEGDCYNREHSIPKSWRGGSKYSDAFMVVPTDGYVNNRRSSYPFGEVGSSSYVSDNSFSKVGTCKTSGYSGTVFEPNDEYKGDFARIYFYAATRYYSECGSWGGDGFSGSFPHLDEWTRVMMLRWHQLDPVSQKEIDRNDAVYDSRQGNRNPFVDYPELVDLIFGSQTSTPFTPGNVTPSAYLDTPTEGVEVNLGTVSFATESPVASSSLYIKGSNITESLTLSISGSSYFTVSQSTLSASDANQGVNVTITYAPAKSGSHTATLTIAGGIRNAVNVSLVGNAVEGFAATEATDITDTSFQANWVKHTQATDYELSVWRTVAGEGVETTLFDVNFADGVPSGWSKVGFTNVENSSLRLASGSNDGTVVTPGLDLSSSSHLTVTCAPYKTSDNSVLYILVDGVEVAQIDCASGEVTETVNLEPATEVSSISLKAVKSHRVFLKSAKLTVGGGIAKEMLDGYPRRVGDVTSYKVQGTTELTDYSYSVTAYNGATKLAESNVITFKTGSSDVKSLYNELPGVYVYAYNGAIYVDDAPCNTRVNCYSLDGTLVSTRTLHATREVMTINRTGIYLVQLITEQGCFTKRVAVY